MFWDQYIYGLGNDLFFISTTLIDPIKKYFIYSPVIDLTDIRTTDHIALIHSVSKLKIYDKRLGDLNNAYTISITTLSNPSLVTCISDT